MSLTSELRYAKSFTRQFIDQKFPHLPALVRERNLLSPTPKNSTYPEYPVKNTYSLIGTATDYRIRSFFTDRPFDSVGVNGGLQQLSGFYGTQTNGDRSIINRLTREHMGEELTDRFRRESRQLLRKLITTLERCSTEQEYQLCRYCMLLAHIDHSYRNIRFQDFFSSAIESGDFDIQEYMESFPKEWTKDVHTLAALFKEANSDLIEKVSNAHCGEALSGSEDIAGADFDLVLDGCLVDIKTTDKPKISSEMLRQLIGYWLLDYDDVFAIRTAAVYFARQNHWVRFEFASDLLKTKKFEVLRRDFQKGIA